MSKILFCSILIILCSCIAKPRIEKGDPKDHSKQNEAIRSQIDSLAENGYWLVTRGYHATDNIVSNATGIPISHVAVLDKSNNRVIEADASGIHFTALDKFIDKSHRVIIMKPRWYTSESGEIAVEKAVGVVGNKYDFLGLIGINVPKKYYCSELAILAYKTVIPESTKFPDIIKPGEMYLYGSILYDSLPRDEWNLDE